MWPPELNWRHWIHPARPTESKFLPICYASWTETNFSMQSKMDCPRASPHVEKSVRLETSTFATMIFFGASPEKLGKPKWGKKGGIPSLYWCEHVMFLFGEQVDSFMKRGNDWIFYCDYMTIFEYIGSNTAVLDKETYLRQGNGSMTSKHQPTIWKKHCPHHTFWNFLRTDFFTQGGHKRKGSNLCFLQTLPGNQHWEIDMTRGPLAIDPSCSVAFFSDVQGQFFLERVRPCPAIMDLPWPWLFSCSTSSWCMEMGPLLATKHSCAKHSCAKHGCAKHGCAKHRFASGSSWKQERPR